MPKLVSFVIKFAVVFAAYFITAKIGLSLDAISGFATLVWAPTGISLAALILFGAKLWPAVFLAAFLVNFSTGAPPLIALGIGVGNTLEALIGAVLLKKFIKIETFLEYLKDVWALVFLAALLSTTISATIGVTSLYLGGITPAAELLHAWSAWWIGDMLGDLIVAPLIISWSRISYPKFNLKNTAESLILLLTIIFSNLFIFLRMFTDKVLITPRLYYIFPVLVWVAIRFEKKAVTLTVAFTSIVAIVATVSNVGPFASATSPLSANLLNLQTFLAVASTTILTLSAAVSEKRRSQQLLEKANVQLSEKVQEKTQALEEAQQIAHVGSWEWDMITNKVNWSDEMYRIYGYKPQEFEVTFEKANARVHPDDLDKINKNVALSLKQFKPPKHSAEGIDYRIVLGNREEHMLHGEGILFADKGGKPVKMTGTVQDITQQHQASSEIKKRAEELERINKLMVGREMKMAELKKDIQKLKKR